jgi:hypothetical protein
MSASGAAKTLANLKKLIDDLPPRRDSRKGEKQSVSLPTPSQGHEEHDEDDEE